MRVSRLRWSLHWIFALHGSWPLRALHERKKGFVLLFFLEKGERPSIADCCILVEERVGRFPLTHHENCSGSCDLILNGIGLEPF